MAYESFRHWQQKAIDQKQTTSALLLALSGAALGFSATEVSNASNYIGVLQSVLFHLHSISFICSLTAGAAFSWNRARDFDMTAQVARARESGMKAPRLTESRKKMRRFGRLSRWLYSAQLITFVFGVIMFIVFVMVRYSSVLY